MADEPNHTEDSETSAPPGEAAGTSPDPAISAAQTGPETAVAEAVPGEADQATARADDGAGGQPAGTKPFDGSELRDSEGGASLANIELLDDVELDVKIELGRTEMLIEDVLRLGVGSVVELDKLAGDPVDIYVNQRLIARGEVLVLNDNFCVRINDIVSPVPELENG